MKKIARDQIGMGMPAFAGSESGFVPFYILNTADSFKGPKKLTVHEGSTYPSFAPVSTRTDQIISNEKLGIAEVFPYWMGRFTAVTEKDIIIGYTSFDREASIWIQQLIGFDLTETEKFFGWSLSSCSKRDRLPREMLTETLRALLQVMADGTGARCRFEHNQAIDPGETSELFLSSGGQA